MKTIKKLDSSVINRIAAGEIIHHPYNAVKELMENSLDAGAKHIQISLTAGGLELIKIKDDGHGIKVNDMPLVCERYATSKLKDFHDLQKLNTFGFRGEALASMSQVAKVIIVSKATDNTFGYQAIYQNGNILSKSKLCASNYGTMILVQNLFENTPSRKKVLKSPNEEYNRILDCVRKYAIHNMSIVFTLRKDDKVAMTDQKATNHMERIQQIYGTNISSRLKSTSYTDSKWNFKIFFSDMIEDNNYRSLASDKKNNIFIIFVNNRLVENAKIKKGVKQVYTNIKSSYKPLFVYISLNVNASHIDVNIHPTKNEVHLLDEDQIVEKITTVLDVALSSIPAPKKQRKKPSPAPLPERATLNHYFKPVDKRGSLSSTSGSSSSNPNTPPASPIPLRKLNLDDYFEKMDTGATADDSDPSLGGFHGGLTPRQRAPSVTAISAFQNIRSPKAVDVVESKEKRAGVYLTKVNRGTPTPPISDTASIVREEEENIEELESILTIKKEIKDIEDKALSKLIANHQHISCIDDVLALIAYKDHFYLINYPIFSEEYFFQAIINQLGKFGKLFLSEPLSIQSCISIHQPTATEEQLNAESHVILSHKELLMSYYSMDVVLSEDSEKVYLTCLPMILRGYVPSLDKLPIFLLNITTQIDWDNEIECLDALAREFSSYYCCCSKTQWEYVLQATHKGDFKAPKYLADRGYIEELDIPIEIMTK